MAYKALETFIFLSISGVFLFSQIEDHSSQRRHMLRLQAGLRSSAYFFAQFTADFIFFMILNVPSFLMVIIGFRKTEIDYMNQGWLVFIELFSKVAFGFILLPLIYLMGFY
jgi:hypothetical protein